MGVHLYHWESGEAEALLNSFDLGNGEMTKPPDWPSPTSLLATPLPGTLSYRVHDPKLDLQITAYDANEVGVGNVFFHLSYADASYMSEHGDAERQSSRYAQDARDSLHPPPRNQPMHRSITTAIAGISIIAALTGCSNSSDNSTTSPTFSNNVLTLDDVKIEIVDVEVTKRNLVTIDYAVTNLSKWDVTLQDAWITHTSLSQSTPSTGTLALIPEGYGLNPSEQAVDSPIVEPDLTLAGSISYRVVDPDAELVLRVFDEKVALVGETTFDLQQ